MLDAGFSTLYVLAYLAREKLLASSFYTGRTEEQSLSI